LTRRDNCNIFKPSEDGKAIMVRFFNAGTQPEKLQLNWGEFKPSAVFQNSPFEEIGKKVAGSVDMPAFGLLTLRMER